MATNTIGRVLAGAFLDVALRVIVRLSASKQRCGQAKGTQLEVTHIYVAHVDESYHVPIAKRC